MAAATLASVIIRTLFFGVMMFAIITAMSETAAASHSFSPLSATPLTTNGNHESQVKGDHRRFKVQSEIVADDYGYWSPNPYFGGGDAGPIPH